MKNLVVIENATVDSLLSNPAAVAVVPCLQHYRDQKATLAKKRCGRCGNTKNRTLTDFYASVKTCLADSSGTAKRALFELLDARQLRITVIRGNRRVVRTIRRS